MKTTRWFSTLCAAGILSAAGPAALAGGGAPWSDDFDSYANGTNLHGVGGWEGWLGDAGATAFVTDDQFRSNPHSVDINTTADLVQGFTVAGGVYTLTAWQFIPSNFTGDTYFLLLNQYHAAQNWSVQVNFDAATNLAVNEGASGGSLPLIRDQWVENRIEIDLDNDTQSYFYNNQLLYSGTWTGEVSGGGTLTLEALDLFANGSSSVYYDDISFTVVPAPAALAVLGLAFGMTARRRRD